MRGRRARFQWRALAAVLALGGPLAVLLARRRRRRGVSAAGDSLGSRREWSCACGQDYLVSGTDRHRIYWAAGAATHEPLLANECVRCGVRLPADREAAAA